MNPLALLGVAIGIGAYVTQRQRPSKQPSHPVPEAVIATIRGAAAKAGVPLQVALAFARVESNLNPAAEGDLHWADTHPDKYRTLVLEMLHDNPFAGDPSRWHSYGLYQLNAAYFTRGLEDPRLLLDPERNASRALPYLHGLLRAAGGDPFDARYRYVGCGPKGVHCADSVRLSIRARLTAALKEFQGVV